MVKHINKVALFLIAYIGLLLFSTNSVNALNFDPSRGSYPVGTKLEIKLTANPVLSDDNAIQIRLKVDNAQIDGFTSIVSANFLGALPDCPGKNFTTLSEVCVSISKTQPFIKGETLGSIFLTLTNPGQVNITKLDNNGYSNGKEFSKDTGVISFNTAAGTSSSVMSGQPITTLSYPGSYPTSYPLSTPVTSSNKPVNSIAIFPTAIAILIIILIVIVLAVYGLIKSRLSSKLSKNKKIFAIVAVIVVGLLTLVIAYAFTQNQEIKSSNAAAITDGGGGGVDLSNDPNNCGTIGQICSTGVCSGGQCIDLSNNPNNCGSTGIICSSGICSGGQCVSPSGGGSGSGTNGGSTTDNTTGSKTGTESSRSTTNNNTGSNNTNTGASSSSSKTGTASSSNTCKACGCSCNTDSDCPMVDGNGFKSVCKTTTASAGKKICVSPLCPDDSELGTLCYCKTATGKCGDKCGVWSDGFHPLCSDGQSSCSWINGPNCGGNNQTYCMPTNPQNSYTEKLCANDLGSKSNYKYLIAPNGTVATTQDQIKEACLTVNSSSSSSSSNAVTCGAIDINGDNKLGIADLDAFGKVYGNKCSDTFPKTGCGGKDTNGDGIINIQDLANFAKFYGQPSCLGLISQ